MKPISAKALILGEGNLQVRQRPLSGPDQFYPRIRKSPESDLQDPEESRELQIASEIIRLCRLHTMNMRQGAEDTESINKIRDLAVELKRIHFQ